MSSDPGNPQVPDITIESRALTLSEQVMLDAAKQLQTESIAVGRDYNKSMLSAAMATTGTYVALLTLLTGVKRIQIDGSVMLLPVALQVTAAAIFTIGFHVKRKTWSLDAPADIERVLHSLATWRYMTSLLGTAFLLASIGLGATLLILKL